VAGDVVKISVPVPLVVKPVEPARDALIVVVPVLLSAMVPPAPVKVSVLPAIVYPDVLNVRPEAVTPPVAIVTVPAVPPKDAASPATHTVALPPTEVDQSDVVPVSHVKLTPFEPLPDEPKNNVCAEAERQVEAAAKASKRDDFRVSFIGSIMVRGGFLYPR
jgi:hypothetical protein